MRARTIVLVLLAILLVAGAVTAAVSLREARSDSCNEETGRGCATTAANCNPERPACQEAQRAARLRAFCAENPRDEKCRTS
ncbi:MAG: hypothetical protein AABY18_02165 [Candidatus Thermoplasmatota archaeon]